MKLMEGKIKKFFIFATVFCFLLALPLEFVQAQGGILGALMAIPINIISIYLQVLLLLSNLIVGIAGLILNWVLSPYFTSLPYTYGGIVDVGWPIVRDLVNMFFIVALVIIGLATALRIKEYQAQKALPRLIIIAILINFTPVICGLIMDAQNIFMNFFLEEVTGFKLLGNLLVTQGTALYQSLIHFFDIRYAATLLGKTIGMIAFDWIAALIFLMYAILFIMRYIMIWVLVIVSPLAFFSWVFPGSQKYLFKSILGWEEWWKQFIEWSLIGIIGAFFLYLGEQLLILAPGMISTIPPDLAWGWLTIPVVEFINNLLPYGVVLAFLIIGFFTATSTSAMGAGAITSFFKEQGMMIGKAAMFPLQRLGVQGIAGAAGILGRAGGLAGKGAGLLEKVPIIGKPLALPVKGMAKGFEAVAVAPLRRYAARARRVDFDEMFKGMEAGEMAEQIGTLLSSKDRVAAAAWMAEKGLIDKPGVDEGFKKQMAREAGDLADTEGYQKSASDVLETLNRFVNEKVSLKLETDPKAREELKGKIGEIAGEISKDEKIKLEIETIAKREGISEEQAARDMAAREIWVGNLKSGDVKDMEKKSFQDIGVRRGMRKWSSAHMSALVNNFKKDVVDNAINGTEGLNAMFEGKDPKEAKAILEKLYEENPRIVHFFATTPFGREWAWKGMNFMPGRKGRPDFGAFVAKMEEKKAAVVPPEEEIKRVEKQIANLEQEMVKPYPKLSPDEQERLREGQKENLEKLKTRLAELKPAEESLTSRIRKAKTKEERKRLEKEFKALPKDLQGLDKQIGRGEGAIETKTTLINEVRKHVEGLKGRGKELEETLTKLKAIPETPPETITRAENRLTAVKGEGTRIEGELALKEKGVEAAKRRIEILRENWKIGLREREKLKTPEEIIREHLTKAIQEEEMAKKRITELKERAGTKEEIETARKRLGLARENKEGWEGELAAQLKMRSLGSKRTKIGSKIGVLEKQMDKAKRTSRSLDTQIEGVSKEIESINRGLTSQRTRIESVRKEREELLDLAQREILSTHPEWKAVPPKVLKERERIDPRFAPLDAEIKATQRTVSTLERNLKTKEATAKRLGEESKKTASRYNALIREREKITREIEKIEEESGKIERGEITPKLSRKEKRKVKKST